MGHELLHWRTARPEAQPDAEGFYRPVPPPATLVLVKCEALHHEPNACGWYAYFDGTPTDADFLAAFRTKYKTLAPDQAAYGPEQAQDAVADRAGLQRWLVCQAV